MQIQWIQAEKRSHGREPEELNIDKEFPEEFKWEGCEEFVNKAEVECLIAELFAV